MVCRDVEQRSEAYRITQKRFVIELEVARNTYADDIRQVRRDEEKVNRPNIFPIMPRINKILHKVSNK